MKLEVTYAREGLPERTSTGAPRAAQPKRPTLAPAAASSAPATEAMDPASQSKASAKPPRAAKSKRSSKTKAKKARRQTPTATPGSMRAAIRGALALPMDLAAERAEPTMRTKPEAAE